MRTRRARLYAAVVLGATMARPTAAAQTASPPLRGPQAVDVSASLRRTAEVTRTRVGTSGSATAVTKQRLATTASVVGGAAVGAWLGYFASQVVMSDWEGMRAADRLPYRRRFAFSGAALGAVGGYLLRPRSRKGPTAQQLATYIYVPRTERHYITGDELRRAVVLNALEAVKALRPEWLDPAAADSAPAAPLTGGAASEDDATVAVYVVNTRVGGPEVLEGIAIPELEELRWYEPEEAARRWGRAHRGGAIEVVPAVRARR